MEIRLTFIIPTLATGGAQMMLWKLLSGMDRQSFLPEVVSLGGNRPLNISLAGRFAELDIPVTVLDFSTAHKACGAFLQLVKHLRQRSPDLVHTWMYHADLIGGLAARWAGSLPVAWNIRHSDLSVGVDRLRTRLVVRACAMLSRRLPVKIVCCAQRALDVHATLGYDRERMEVIPNGFDLARFRPMPDLAGEVRQELNIDPNALVIGLVGRFHPQKGHAVFIEAARLLIRNQPDTHFVLCGDGVDWQNPPLAETISQAGLGERFRLLGRREDMPRLSQGLDVATSSSLCGEGFSNTIGEAMACGLPCVVTDVGDSASIVGDTGRVVPPGDAQALTEAWRRLAILGAEGRKKLGELARQRMETHFSLPVIIERYQQLYRDLAVPPYTKKVLG